MSKPKELNIVQDILEASRRKQFTVVKPKVAALEENLSADDRAKLKECLVLSGLSNDIELVKAYLQLGLPISSSCKGNSILCLAARIPYSEFILELIQLGADADQHDSENATPLIHVARAGIDHRENRDLFLENLAVCAEHTKQIDAADDFGRTALDYCCIGNWDVAALLLLRNGAQLAAGDESGWWALRGAVETSNTEVLRQLLKQDGAAALADIDSDGTTIVRYAAEHGWVRHVEVLLSAGVKDRLANGRSVAEVAKEKAKGLNALDDTLARFGIVRGSQR